jgi:hypothetical protein
MGTTPVGSFPLAPHLVASPLRQVQGVGVITNPNKAWRPVACGLGTSADGDVVEFRFNV